MTDSNKAFETLKAQLEEVLDEVKNDGAKAFQDGDFEKANALMKRAKELLELQAELESLKKRWNVKVAPEGKGEKKSPDRIETGLITSDDAYQIPILKAIGEMGGAGHIQKVTDRVGEIMDSVLNEHDRAVLPNTPTEIRWRNKVAWVRYHLVQEGLLKSDSPKGTWEISVKGRKWLEAQLNRKQ